MPNKNLWNNKVPRIEYDLRARDARLRLERVERLLVKRDAAATTAGFRYFRLVNLLISNLAGGDGKHQGTGSPSDRRPCSMRLRPARLGSGLAAETDGWIAPILKPVEPA